MTKLFDGIGNILFGIFIIYVVATSDDDKTPQPKEQPVETRAMSKPIQIIPFSE